jgi:hypothetical protein
MILHAFAIGTDRSAAYADGMDSARTWAALLGKWTEFAQSAVALPSHGEPGRWKRAVPAIIAVQAVTHALDELPTIDPAEIGPARLRAAVVIAESSRALYDLWDGQVLPLEASQLLEDADAALAAAESIGFGALVASPVFVGRHPARVVAALEASGRCRGLFVPTPGVPLFAGSPAIHLIPSSFEEDPFELAQVVAESIADQGDLELVGLASAAQVYRQMDFGSGRPVRDVVMPLVASPVAGQPLLVAAIAEGKSQPVSLPPRKPLRVDPVPVVFGLERDEGG